MRLGRSFLVGGILLLVAGSGGWFWMRPQSEPEREMPVDAAVAPEVESDHLEAVPEVVEAAVPSLVKPESSPEPLPEPVPVSPVEQVAPVAAVVTPAQRRVQQRMDRLLADFDRKKVAYRYETDPQRRKQRLEELARYVRVDTQAAFEWAMSLPTEEEQRAALEAVNRNALTGIGAIINADETGLPRIMETTVLGAIESSGKAETGDYIVGMIDGQGAMVDFHGLSMSRVSQMLRGKAGSEVKIRVMRPGDAEETEEFFDVSLPRSLIVVQPEQVLR